MPNRILKESICYSDDVDRLTPFEETVFYRLMVNVDDFGRLDARTAFLKSKLFVTKQGVTDKSIKEAISKLSLVGLVKLYEVENKPFLVLTKWDCHQQIRAKRSKYPEPTNENICNQMISDDSKCARNPIQSESNPNLNPNPNPKGADAPDGEPNKSPKDSVPYEKIKELHNSICTSLPKVLKIEGNRKSTVATRWKENSSLEFFEELFRTVQDSHFLTGSNDTGWTASFDWLMKPTNLVKVLEGNYRNKTKSPQAQSQTQPSGNVFLNILNKEGKP